MFFVQQVNDFVRDKFTDKDNNIPFIAEIMAGGCVSSRSPTSCYMSSRLNSRELEMQRRLHVSLEGPLSWKINFCQFVLIMRSQNEVCWIVNFLRLLH